MEIKGHKIDFIEEGHIYLVDGVVTPSVTQVLKYKFGHKYDNIDNDVLSEAARKGTEVHKAIEDYCTINKESDLPEVRNFKFLQKKYNFKVLGNEIPIILFKDDKPLCAGRLDLVLFKDNQTGLGDIKRTSALDKEYLGYQLNMYRIAYKQCYGGEIDFLAGLHLRDNVRKFVNIPINEDLIWSYLNEWAENNKHELDVKDIFL